MTRDTRPELERRRDAAEATRERFLGRPLVWGRDDCARMAAFTLRRLGKRVTLVKAGAYSTPKAALRALKRAGFDTLEQALDDGFGLQRVPPAYMLPADIVGLPGEGGLALTVALGNGNLLGFQEGDGPCVVLTPFSLAPAIVWRSL